MPEKDKKTEARVVDSLENIRNALLKAQKKEKTDA